MDDLRTVLRDKAEEMRLDPEMPAGLRRRTRGRRILTASVTFSIVAAAAIGSYAGLRVALHETGGARPVTPAGAGLEGVPPVYPAYYRLEYLQQNAERGIAPVWLDPKQVGFRFADDAMGWHRGDTRVEVLSTDPPRVAIWNPSLTVVGTDHVRTILNLGRYEGREDGIYVVTTAESDAVQIETPRPWQQVVPGEDVSVRAQLNTVQEGGGFFALIGTVPGGVPTEETFSVEPGKSFAFSLRAPDQRAVAARFELFDAEGTTIASTVFRLNGTGDHIPPPPDPGLTPAAEDTRQALLRAALDRDWEAIEALISDEGFTFGFGGEQNPIAFYQRLLKEGEDDPLTVLAVLLRYPAVDDDGLYIWPAAAVKDPRTWTDEDIETIQNVYPGEDLRQMSHQHTYYGWRVGIEPDGDWIFFVQGD